MDRLVATQMIARGIEVSMFVGICNFEYLKPQKVIVNVEALGYTPYLPTEIEECLDYSKICEFVKQWGLPKRPHTMLIESLLVEAMEFCFNQDPRIFEVRVEIIKPEVISHAQSVGVARQMSRVDFEHFQKLKLSN